MAAALFAIASFVAAAISEGHIAVAAAWLIVPIALVTWLVLSDLRQLIVELVAVWQRLLQPLPTQLEGANPGEISEASCFTLARARDSIP